MTVLDNAAKPGIIVDLDALFDTRLSTLHRIDPMLAAHALQDGYQEREEDAFKYCSFDTFKEVYKLRNEETLGGSVMTSVKDIVIDFMRDCVSHLKSEKSKNFVSVYINVWPYKISADAVGDILKPFYDAVDGKANIHVVNLKPEELTPEVCKNNFSYVVKYDYMEWLIKLGELGLLQKTPLQEITLIAPRLYPGGKPSNVEVEEVSRSQMEPYQCAELYFAPYIKLELYVSRLFSANLSQKFIDDYIKEITLYQEENKNATA